MTDASFACVINDTSEWYHWGCHGTSLGLQELIARTLQPGITSNVPIAYSYAPSYVPETAEALRDPRSAVKFLKTWPAAHALLEASEIIINAEGTIHGDSDAARRLLYIAFLCTRFLGKRVYLVNGSLFPPEGNPDALDLYRLGCASVHHLAVRESHSARLARGLAGREPRLAFDCLPLGLSALTLKPSNSAPSYAVIAGTSGMNNFMAAILKTGADRLARNGLRLMWLLGAPRQPAADEAAQAREHAPAIGAEVVTATSFEEWARLIRDARFLFAGRFHYIIARLCLGGHFAAFGGNTPKIRAMLGDVGLGDVTIGSPADVVPTFIRAGQLAMPPRLAELAQAASLNLTDTRPSGQPHSPSRTPAGKPDACLVRTIA